MHLIVPFASGASDGLRAALHGLRLPNTAALLARAPAALRDEGDELSLSPPHERALAQALGLGGGDGTRPLAAALALRDGIDPAGRAWGLLMPAHWRVGTGQVSLVDPDDLGLDEAGSRTLMEALRPLFASEGFELHFGAPTRWYAAHDALQGLACASPDRVIGRPVDRWLWPGPPTAASRRVRRLQNEVQMLLHAQALNQARDAAGELTVNSFWISGCGAAPGVAWPDDVVVDDRLRRPALQEDAQAWSAAWQALDGGPIATALQGSSQGAATIVTLCGERCAATLEMGPRSGVQRLRALLRRPDPVPWLESL